MIKRAACYCRVSTKKEEQLQSMEMQKQYFKEYCKNNTGYELYEIYADEGISGKSLKNRKAFDRMITDAKNGCFDVILVKDFSRFARNTVDLLTIVRMLKDIGIEVYFVNYNMTNLGESELVLTMMGALAQEESAALSKKLKLSKNMNAQRGRVPNFVYGYDRIDTFTLVPNEYEAGWVRRIFEMYVHDGMGTAKIAEYLNNNMVRTKRNILNGWSQHIVSYLLRNELYVGRVVNGKSTVTDFKTGKRRQFGREGWITVERPEFVIVDGELFKMAQILSESRRNSFNKDKKRQSNKYPLSNLIVCANDGYSFRRCSRQYCNNGTVYVWWTCSYRNIKGADACRNTILLYEDQMHSAILGLLNNMCPDRETMEKQVHELVSKELRRRYDGNRRRKELLSGLKALETKKSRLLDAYADGVICKNDLDLRLKPITTEINEVRTSLKIHDKFEKTLIDADAWATELIKDLDTSAERLLSNTFLKTIFEKFVVYQDGRITVSIKAGNNTGSSLELPFGEIICCEAV